MRYEYPKGVRFECNRCALCCRDTAENIRQILLLETEAHRISEETSRSIKKFAEETGRSDLFAYRMKKTEGKCFFLRDNLCSIYNVRPIICRFYPFKLENLGKDRYAFSYTGECPGIGKGTCLKRSFFQDLFKLFLNSMSRHD